MTYVPILPLALLELLEAPGTFIMGCHSDHRDYIDRVRLSTVAVSLQLLFTVVVAFYNLFFLVLSLSWKSGHYMGVLFVLWWFVSVISC